MKLKTLVIGAVLYILLFGTAYASTLGNSFVSYKILENKSVVASGFFVTAGLKGSLKNGSTNGCLYVTCTIDGKVTRKSFGSNQIFEGIYLVHSVVNEKLNIYFEIHKALSRDNEVMQVSAKDCVNILPSNTIISETLSPLEATTKPKKVHLSSGYVLEYVFVPNKF